MTDPAQPPAVPAPADQAVAPAAVPVRKGRGLGVFALVVGILAFLVDVIFFIVAIASIGGAIANLGAGDFSSLALAVGGFAFIGFIILIGGIVTGLLAVILGLVAAITGRGRVAGVFAIIFGVLVLISRIIVFSALSGSGDLLSQITSGAA